ncbi:hypothetical protein RB623_26505 [Mesorhizobium sp. LHD-90]|uniref:hypothetical protein n=1 Tax=Mesorhizobium sp. LHD-90 TaxID=3071414 RepID=UPI0027DEBBA8|nr:hypothetical protein [Mesorhizobium sp. LHD-90]MDQ6437620.1 hypothetical protein [Mesorhizobium sp. LHD-90]
MTIAVLATTAAFAQTATKYGEEGGWEILIKDDMGPGCLVTRSNPDGATQVQMGIDTRQAPKGYLAIYTKADAKAKAGEKLSVTFEVDGQEFSGQATGQQVGEYHGAYVWVNNPEFIYDLAKKKTLRITVPGRDPLVLNLAGTNKAFEKLRECQAAQS